MVVFLPSYFLTRQTLYSKWKLDPDTQCINVVKVVVPCEGLGPVAYFLDFWLFEVKGCLWEAGEAMSFCWCSVPFTRKRSGCSEVEEEEVALEFANLSDKLWSERRGRVNRKVWATPGQQQDLLYLRFGLKQVVKKELEEHLLKSCRVPNILVTLHLLHNITLK